ncbi:hypothetical protein Scep_001619 [Stephania cephalantha]|uniref:Uncharacterized protein n=1 Tax=Stephania cephalantha TaxID=152367 RepID=A0AAP0L9P3_9MAGN
MGLRTSICTPTSLDSRIRPRLAPDTRATVPIIDNLSLLLALHMAAMAANTFFRLSYNNLGVLTTINHPHFKLLDPQVNPAVREMLGYVPLANFILNTSYLLKCLQDIFYILACQSAAANVNTNIPSWLSPGAHNLIRRIFNPNPATRISIAEIKEDGWFNQDYITSTNHDDEELEDDFQIKDNVITLIHPSHYLVELNKSHGDSSLYRKVTASSPAPTLPAFASPKSLSTATTPTRPASDLTSISGWPHFLSFSRLDPGPFSASLPSGASRRRMPRRYVINYGNILHDEGVKLLIMHSWHPDRIAHASVVRVDHSVTLRHRRVLLRWSKSMRRAHTVVGHDTPINETDLYLSVVEHDKKGQTYGLGWTPLGSRRRHAEAGSSRPMFANNEPIKQLRGDIKEMKGSLLMVIQDITLDRDLLREMQGRLGRME